MGMGEELQGRGGTFLPWKTFAIVLIIKCAHVTVDDLCPPCPSPLPLPLPFHAFIFVPFSSKAVGKDVCWGEWLKWQLHLISYDN